MKKRYDKIRIHNRLIFVIVDKNFNKTNFDGGLRTKISGFYFSLIRGNKQDKSIQRRLTLIIRLTMDWAKLNFLHKPAHFGFANQLMVGLVLLISLKYKLLREIMVALVHTIPSEVELSRVKPTRFIVTPTFDYGKLFMHLDHIDGQKCDKSVKSISNRLFKNKMLFILKSLSFKLCYKKFFKLIL